MVRDAHKVATRMTERSPNTSGRNKMAAAMAAALAKQIGNDGTVDDVELVRSTLLSMLTPAGADGGGTAVARGKRRPPTPPS